MGKESKDKPQGTERKLSEKIKDFSEVGRHVMNAEKELLMAGKSVLEVFIGWIDEVNAPKKKIEKIKIE